LTNGAQVKTGSCNGIPMGVIGAQSKMPSSKFTSPANLDVIPPNEDFTIRMKINNVSDDTDSACVIGRADAGFAFTAGHW